MNKKIKIRMSDPYRLAHHVIADRRWKLVYTGKDYVYFKRGKQRIKVPKTAFNEIDDKWDVLEGNRVLYEKIPYSLAMKKARALTDNIVVIV